VERFMKCFVREKRGHWRCFEAAELVTPVGRIQVTPGTTFTRGTRFMNFDVAAALDDAYALVGTDRKQHQG
jgi:hypothetical protein